MMNLGRSGNAHELHYELLKVFTQFLDENKDLRDIRETFLSMDDDNTGAIEIEELRGAFEEIKKQYENEKSKSEVGSSLSVLEGLTTEKIGEILEHID